MVVVIYHRIRKRQVGQIALKSSRRRRHRRRCYEVIPSGDEEWGRMCVVLLVF